MDLKSSLVSILLGTTAISALPAQQSAFRTDFTSHVVPLDELVMAIPRDAIPAIDEPVFVTGAEAGSWLSDREPVAVVRVEDEVAVYPLQILIWHEIVNDVVGGQPVAVTFCPLCNTTLAFDRRHGERVLDFGTTGWLRHSDLVMYDRQTETWWQQATGRGLVGELAGERLTFVPAPVMPWADVVALYPGARVLSRETGHDRRYGRNPYPGYDRIGNGPFRRFFDRVLDNRLEAMERVATVSIGEEHAAWAFEDLSRDPVRNSTVADLPLVLWWEAGTSSALDSRNLGDGRDVGSTVVFDRRLGEEVLSFELRGSTMRDDRTGSLWNRAGLAIAGPYAGRQLSTVPHGNHFWFAWSVFQPETTIR